MCAWASVPRRCASIGFAPTYCALSSTPSPSRPPRRSTIRRAWTPLAFDERIILSRPHTNLQAYHVVRISCGLCRSRNTRYAIRDGCMFERNSVSARFDCQFIPLLIRTSTEVDSSFSPPFTCSSALPQRSRLSSRQATPFERRARSIDKKGQPTMPDEPNKPTNQPAGQPEQPEGPEEKVKAAARRRAKKPQAAAAAGRLDDEPATEEERLAELRETGEAIGKLAANE